MSVDVRISPRLLRNLRRLGDRLSDQLKAETIETALVEIETVAKTRARVDTGRLRASIHTKYRNVKANHNYKDRQGKKFRGRVIARPKNTKNKFTCIVGTDVAYARKIERLDPYLSYAYVRARPIYIRNLQRIIRN
jgi:hypothetical protein